MRGSFVNRFISSAPSDRCTPTPNSQSEAVYLAPPTADLEEEIDQLVDNEEFAEEYRRALETVRKDPDSDLLEAVIGHYCVYFTPRCKTYDETAQLLMVRAGQEFGVPSRLLRSDVIRREIANTVRYLRG
ncbi:MAG: hypothetical protein HXY34_05840 [Candidatus Thorarchaeota archaeon]|nr:hypothetical protein [Candidatus Thorarchaeota archaeon]